MGELTIFGDNSANSTVVSNIFIDEYMRDANDAQLKIYLYLLRTMSAGRPTSIRELADQFNHTEVEVVRSLTYWEGQGLLALQRDGAGNITSIHLCTPRPKAAAAVPITVAPADPAPAAQQAPAPEKPRQKPVSAEDKAQLLFIVEQYIGKPLSVSEMNTVYYILDDLQFSSDLVDYLFQYCVGMDKRDFKYIQKVALNWANEGITTVRQAQKNVQKGPRRRQGKTPESIHHFQQNHYDFDALEEQLLSN